MCYKRGHVAADCWHRFDEDYVPDDKLVAAATYSHGAYSNWYVDMGATDHITSQLEKLNIREVYKGHDQIHTASGAGMKIKHIGHAIVHTPTRPLHLNNVLHVPQAAKNLISATKLASDNSVFVEIHSKYFLIKDRTTRSTVLKGPRRHGLYPLPSTSSTKQAFAVAPSLERWHSRLGHPSIPIVMKVISSNKLPCLRESNKESVCDACQKAKSHQLPYSNSLSVSNKPLELIYSDVWGPASTSFGGKKFYVSFIDSYSKFSWIYLLKHKSDVFEKFHDFQQLVERLFDRKIIAMQTDWGGEYQKLNSFFEKIGISHHVSCPHTHQQNGSAERKHRLIVEVGLALLAYASMPLKYWDEAFLAATHIINRIPSRILQYDTPLKRLFNHKPNYSSFRIFGCACWPNLRPYNAHKLQFRSMQCVFLGPSHTHKGYKCLDIATGRIYISRDVVFDENVFPFSKLHSNAGSRLRSEIALLPSHLLSHTSHQGGEHNNHMLDFYNVSSDQTDENADIDGGNTKDTANDDLGTSGNVDVAADSGSASKIG